MVLKRFYVKDDRRIDAASPEFDFNFDSGKNDEFATNVTGLRFIAYDKNGNEDTNSSWDTRNHGNQLPAKLKIIITVEAGKGSAATNPDYVSREFSSTVTFH